MRIFLRTSSEVPFSPAWIFVYVIQLLFNKVLASAIFPVKGITPYFMLLTYAPCLCFLLPAVIDGVKAFLFVLLSGPLSGTPCLPAGRHKAFTITNYGIDAFTCILKCNKCMEMIGHNDIPYNKMAFAL